MTNEVGRVVHVQGYQRRKQLAPKTWLVTTVKPHQRRRPHPHQIRPAEARGEAA